MVNYYLVKSKFFIVFLAISTMAFSVIPFVRRALAEASDSYVKERMHLVQAEMFFYDLSPANLKYICVAGDISLLQHEITLESGAGLSCTVDELGPSISFYTALKKSDGVYCVDTYGFKGLVAGNQPSLPGRCSK